MLALLGKRVPAAMRVLLLALAIIDDIGARSWYGEEGFLTASEDAPSQRCAS